MSLQTSLTTRRQFLERSAWGFGSAFLLPSLLTSCTDHIIDPVIPPSTNPPLLGDNVDTELSWSDLARSSILFGLGKIPEVGEILAPLVEIFWPANKPDIWDQIRVQVETLVKQSIAEFDYNLVYEDLQGLNNNVTIYIDYVNSGTPSEILTQWILTRGLFLNALPHFQSKDNQLPLLPLFAQFANMYLSLLRDPLLPVRDSNGNPVLDDNGKAKINGKTWGMTDGDIHNVATALQKNISDFYTYTSNTYNTGRGNLAATVQRNNELAEPFRSINQYDRQMTQTVLNFMDTWQYYDATLYPNATTVTSNREIYSDPYGTTNKSDVPGTNTHWPTQRPTMVSVWSINSPTSGTFIKAVQVTYPANSGPGGVTITPRMGQDGGDRRDFALTPGNPIIAGRAVVDESFGLVLGLQFLYADRTSTDFLGGNKGVYSNDTVTDTGMLGYNYMFVSSIYVFGPAESIVFGYQFWNPPAAQLNAARTLYVKSPKEYSADEFAKALPTLAIAANFITDELKLARKAYWAYVHARAKALK